jgi:hypothetical protein
MLASTLGIEFDPDATWNERKLFAAHLIPCTRPWPHRRASGDARRDSVLGSSLGVITCKPLRSAKRRLPRRRSHIAAGSVSLVINPIGSAPLPTSQRINVCLRGHNRTSRMH